jgi:Domain of unknown function (DUF4388)
LPELLQWLDSSRKTGALQLTWEGGERKLFVLAGQVVATASRGLWERVTRALHQGALVDGRRLIAALRQSDRLEGAHDLGPEVRGWVRERHALLEALRYLDEQPDVDRVLALDTLTVRAATTDPVGLPVLQRVLLTLTAAPEGVNLGKLRLMLGCSASGSSRPLGWCSRRCCRATPPIGACASSPAWSSGSTPPSSTASCRRPRCFARGAIWPPSRARRETGMPAKDTAPRGVRNLEGAPTA